MSIERKEIAKDGPAKGHRYGCSVFECQGGCGLPAGHCDCDKALREQFCREAEAGHFGWALAENGEPYAMGAKHTGNLFDVPYIEKDDPFNGGSLYLLDSEWNLASSI